jgi:hypothetical protein
MMVITPTAIRASAHAVIMGPLSSFSHPLIVSNSIGRRPALGDIKSRDISCLHRLLPVGVEREP